MSKHGKLVTVLRKLYLIEDAQRSVKEIRKRTEYYERRNLELASKGPNGIPEGVQKEIYIDTKISELKWTTYDDGEADIQEHKMGNSRVLMDAFIDNISNPCYLMA